MVKTDDHFDVYNIFIIITTNEKVKLLFKCLKGSISGQIYIVAFIDWIFVTARESQMKTLNVR
jgi:hypothetical protein